MPRLNVGRSVQSEANLAKRIAHERERRGQSYESLAEAMTKAGCAIAGSSIYKIEKGTPPRRVSVDELVTLADVWDLEINDLLTPMELIEQARARELVETLQRNERNLLALTSDVFNVLVDLIWLKRDDQDVYDYVMNHWFNNPRGLSTEDRAGLSDGDDLREQAVFRASRDVRETFLLALLRTAALWVEAGERDLTSGEVADVHRALESDEPWISRTGWLFDTTSGGN